jgi:hypothetical protein
MFLKGLESTEFNEAFLYAANFNLSNQDINMK